MIRSKVARFAAAVLTGTAVLLTAAACEEDATSTATVAPTATATVTASATGSPTATATASPSATATGTDTATATASETATVEPTATASGREEILSQFPDDARALLEAQDIEDSALQLLLEVRQEGPGTLRFNSTGGELATALDIAFLDEWEVITGWTVQQSAPVVTLQEIRTKVGAGQPEWDVLHSAPPPEIQVLADEGLLEPLDYDVLQYAVESWPEQYPGFEKTDYAIGPDFSFANLIWNTDVWPMEGPHPDSVLDIFNTEEFPGPRCMFNYPQFAGTLEYPLLADGVPVEDLYPLDIDRALAKLDTIKEDIVWWGSGAESIQFLLDGQCDLGITWHGRPAVRLRDEPDLPIGVAYGDALASYGWMAIPKGAQYKAAMSSIAYLLTAQNTCDYTNEIGYAIPLDTSCYNEFGQAYGATDENFEGTFAENYEYYYENIEEVSEKFSAWLASE